MNKIYKLVWSKVRNCWVAVSEIAKSNSKDNRSSLVDRRALENKIGLQLQNGYYGSAINGNVISIVPSAYTGNSAINEKPISTDFKITVAAIVKNEAKNVSQWVKAARSCADEIVVVDTGSTDGTVEKFRDYGIECYHYDWNDDFASAKNYMISLCHGDWIVLLDGDEWFRDGCDVRKAIAKHHNNPVEKAIIADWICLDSSRNNMIMFSGGAVRAFRNHPSIRYFRKVHENLTLGYNNFVFEPEFKMYHTGYSGDVNRSKHERNLRIMRTMFDFDNGKVEYPTDWRYVQDTYAGLGNYEKSMEASDRMLEYGVQEYSAASWITRFNVLFAMKADLQRMDKEFEYCFKTTPSVSGFRFLAAIYYFKNGVISKGLENYIEGLRMLMGPQDKVALEHTYWRMYLPEASMLASAVYLKNKQAEAALYACKVSEQYCGQTVWTDSALTNIRYIVNGTEEVSVNISERLLPVLQFSKKAVLASALVSSLAIGVLGTPNQVFAACCNLNGVATNQATGTDATVTGGACNIANTEGSSVSGGCCNTAGCWGYFFEGTKHDATSIKYISPNDPSIDSNGIVAVYNAPVTITNGEYASVNGGCFNFAFGNASSVLGGQRNSAIGDYSTIGGGQCNIALAQYSNVTGGKLNTTNSDKSVIVGGQCNITGSYYWYSENPQSSESYRLHVVPITCSAVSNGYIQVGATCYRVFERNGYDGVVVGGQCNANAGGNSVIVGGSCNVTIGYESAIVSGYCNIADGSNSAVLGGRDNVASGFAATVVSGNCNSAYGDSGFIAGGSCNYIAHSVWDSSIVGGSNNLIKPVSNYPFNSVIVGGSGNSIYDYGEYGTILGGSGNGVYSSHATAVGGLSNYVYGESSVAVGGNSNIIGTEEHSGDAFYSVLIGGECNAVNGNSTALFGGQCNAVGGDWNTVVGGTSNIVGDAHSYVNNSGKTVYIQGTCDDIYEGSVGDYYGSVIDVNGNTYPVGTYEADGATAFGGCYNRVFGDNSSTLGGQSNFIDNPNAVITGGYNNKISSNAYYAYTDLDGVRRYIPAGTTGLDLEYGTYTDADNVAYSVSSLSSNFATITGGKCNAALGNYSAVVGGDNNKAFANCSSITGGCSNQAEGDYSTISGGQCNLTKGSASMAVGGENSRAYANKSVAIGGGITGDELDTTVAVNSVAIGSGATTTRNNEVAIGSASAPVKLDGNLTVGTADTVTDGTTTKTWSDILNAGSGGSGGTVTADGIVERNNTGIVTGGTVWNALNTGRNSAHMDRVGEGTYAWGGTNNIVSGKNSMSIGSDISDISGSHSMSIGGDGANIQGDHSLVLNSVDFNYETNKDDPTYNFRHIVDDGGTVVMKGNNGTALGTYTRVVRKENPAEGEYPWNSIGNTVLNGNADIAIGGTANTINGDTSVVFNGIMNTVGGCNSAVINGFNSEVNSDWSLAIGSTESKITGNNDSIIIGGRGNEIAHIQGVQGSASNTILVGGKDNKIVAGYDNNVILGGYENNIEDTQADYLFGGNNAIISSFCSVIRDSEHSVIIGGGGNELAGNINTMILGSDNQIDSNSWASTVVGYSNKVEGRGLVFGEDNTVHGSMTHGHIYGDSNNVGRERANSSSYVYGYQNVLGMEDGNTADNSIVFGRGNKVDSSDVVVVGYDNTLVGSSEESFISGAKNKFYATENDAVFGNENDFSNVFTSNVGVYGYKNSATGASDGMIFCANIYGNNNDFKTDGNVESINDNSIYGNSNLIYDSGASLIFGSNNKLYQGSINSVAFGFNNTIKSANAVSINGTVDENADNSLAVFGTTKAEGAMAIGKDSVVAGTNSIAIGKNAVANDDNSLALGSDSIANGRNIVSVGHNATDLDTDGQAYGTVLNRKITNVAAGTLSETSTDAVIGAQLYATNQNIAGFAADITRNKNNIASLNTSVTAALGSVSSTSSLVSTLNDIKADASLNNLTAAGRNVIATAAINAVQEYMATQNSSTEPETSSAPMMYGSNPNTLSVTDAGNGSLHVGEGSYVNGTSSIAIGVGNQVNANNSGAFGDPSIINADESYVLGNDDTINTGATGSFVIGNDSVSSAKGGLSFGSNNVLENTADNSIAFGNNVSVTGKNSVALGSDSTAVEDNIISVGNDTLKRKITNVADGNLADGSTDVVTGSQLFATNEKVKENANAIAQKADLDASNINVEDWATKLGTGVVEDGNTGLVNGGTVYNAIQKVQTNQFVQQNGNTLSIGSTIGGTTISVANNAGEGRVITDVITDPTNMSSVANVGYVQSVSETLVNSVNNSLGQMDTKINKVGANAAAMASLTPASFEGDEKWSLSAGVGNYKGETAGAVGAFYKPTENVMMNVRGSFGNNENMIGAAVSVSLSKGDVPGVTKRQLATKVNRLEQTHEQDRNQIAQLNQHIVQQDERIANQDAQIAELKAMVQNMAEQMNKK